MSPFQSVPRLPVPPEVDTAFRRLRSANIGEGYANSARRNAFNAAESGLDSQAMNTARAASERASGRVAQATEEAASHFGGDVGKMMTHFKRWTRWGGKAMGAADFVLPKESVDEGMQKSKEAMSPRLTVVRKKYPSTAPSEGA